MTMFQNLSRMMAGGAALKIKCEACGRQTTWRSDEAFRRLGPDATPYEIRRRLVCIGCGATGWVQVWI
jgi:hypothetical protein